MLCILILLSVFLGYNLKFYWRRNGAEKQHNSACSPRTSIFIHPSGYLKNDGSIPECPKVKFKNQTVTVIGQSR